MGSFSKATGQAHASRHDFWRNEKSVYSSDTPDDSALNGDAEAIGHVCRNEQPHLNHDSTHAPHHPDTTAYDEEWNQLCGRADPDVFDPDAYDEDGNSAREYDDTIEREEAVEFFSSPSSPSSDFYATIDDVCEFDAEAAYVNFNDFEFEQPNDLPTRLAPARIVARFAGAATALAGTVWTTSRDLFEHLVAGNLKQAQDRVFTLSIGKPKSLSLPALPAIDIRSWLNFRPAANLLLGNWSRYRPALAMAAFTIALIGGTYATVVSLMPGSDAKQAKLVASRQYTPYTNLRPLPETIPSDKLRGSAATTSLTPPETANETTEAADNAPVVDVFTTQHVTLGKGDTLSVVLARAGVSAPDIHRASRSLADTFNPKRLRAGQQITLTFQNVPHVDSETVQASLAFPSPSNIIDFGADHDQADDFTPRLVAMEIKTALDRSVRVERTGAADFSSREIMAKLHERYAHAYGEISSSLYVAAAAKHVPVQAIAELIRMYSYDVDFQRDIRSGDSFEIFYKEYVNDDGDVVKTGDVIFATMTVHGEPYAYYRFVTPDDGMEGYYDATGQSAKKFLMKTPVDGARISSTFGMREHPILGYTKMHTGIDFAVRAGTPIMAAGNGVVVRAGWNGGYGNYIQLRHSNGYETAYGHMRAFAKGIKAGVRVKQGQTIGYVGTTGRSTGPHLHYEVHKNGQKINPAKVKTMNGRKLTGDMLTTFKKKVGLIETEMAQYPVDKPVVTASVIPEDKPVVK